MRRRRSTGWVSIAAAVLLAAGVLTPSAAVAGGTDTAAQARAEHERIVAFWTPERVAKAVPRDFVRDPTTGTFRPAAKPSKPGGGGSSDTVLGASWTMGGEVVATTGKVLFQMGSSYYVCSASVVDDGKADRSLILTAAHCVYDETAKKFATNWMFVPDYDAQPAPLTTDKSFCAQTKYGCWTASALVVHNGYASAGGFNDQATRYDFAFAVVGAGGSTDSQLDSLLLDGQPIGHPIDVDGVQLKSDTYLFGYPAGGRYKGNDLVYCRGPLGTDPLNANETYRVGCNMTGGSSGGPWFSPFNTSQTGRGSGTLMSVNSYGYSGITAMHGPMLNEDTKDLLVAAARATGNTSVPTG